MKSSRKELNKECSAFTCCRCSMFYNDYKQLLAHLYWKHGTESQFCNKCALKKWRFAVHVCHTLPLDDIHDENGAVKSESEYYFEKDQEDEQYCLCGRWQELPMIGCDDPQCTAQWYHFPCVGIVDPPDGDWFCPRCLPRSGEQRKTDEVKR